jgi:hypothetical protein
MRRAVLALGLSFALGLWTSMVPGRAATAAPWAIWIWEEDAFRMLDQSVAEREVASFLDQQHITTIYLYADEFAGRNILVNQPEKYRRLIANAHARRISVYALLGSAYLKTQEYILPEKRAVAIRMFGRVLEFNASTPEPSSRFDGVNVDIEPYLLDDWASARPLRGQQYLDLSAEFMRMKAAVGATLVVGPAMPFWFDGIDDVEWNGQRRRLNERVQDLYDYVAIMDYRNFALGSDGIVSHAQDELDYADRVGKKVMIGVETLRTTPEKVTFFGKSQAYLDAQLAAAEAAVSQHRSFGGFVIHHLSSYRVLVLGG